MLLCYSVCVAPSQGRGLKLNKIMQEHILAQVAPSQGRGLKLLPSLSLVPRSRRRPFTGAWIEIYATDETGKIIGVAPSQGRGLKSDIGKEKRYIMGVAPSQGRGLKCRRDRSPRHLRCRPFTGAWIEITSALTDSEKYSVAPSQGRGLKYYRACLYRCPH